MANLGIPTTRSRFITTYHYMRDPYGCYRKWKVKFGKTFVVRALNGDVVATWDQENIRRIFALNSNSIAPFAVGTVRPLVGDKSVFTVQGEEHKRERSLLMPSFHGDLMRQTTSTIQDVAIRAAESWQANSTIRVMDSALDISLEVILRVVFGLQDQTKIENYKQTITNFVTGFHPLLGFSKLFQRPLFGLGPWNKFVKARKEFNDLLYREIEERRKTNFEDSNDLLSRLMSARYDDGSTISEEAIRDHLVTLLLAGHETTQIAIAWAMSWLGRNPKIVERLQSELDETEFDDAVNSSKLLTGICNESLRLNPILPDVVRVAKVPIELTDVTIPVGTAFAPSTFLAHYDPEIFEDPEKFDPDRWSDRTYKPTEYFPFGGGVRRCIGAALANLEMKIVVAAWVKEFNFELLEDAPRFEPVHRRNLTMAPSSGVKLRFLGKR